ncbi:hypothetical protein NEIMUCOT_05845 [Neisseria mucosa ATCC 25996]|uniref:Uncharacterized protein n=1 Tax=Neisseria mucosa (strain ATCC 25996 / DSM 4631 / NCTC 10774 / M26) TaxID=546266 RepID=D2ZYX9_NEIM2|nr:hypothetical protein NEIMUCOT_05845 [Neisseria mucosa ATCC 25996]
MGYAHELLKISDDLSANYSGLNLNQYGVVSPCRTICTVCGFVALS